jgi:NAD(P)H dehydrogenase (quinone)
MEQVNVVIAFYSRYCETEKLALNLGLGVLQARATPRFRRIPDLAPQAVIDADPEWKKNLARMKIEYVVPRPGDPKLADVLVLATPGDDTAEVLEFAKQLATDGSLKGKFAAPLCARNREATVAALSAIIAPTGMIVVEPPLSDDPAEAARLFGTELVRMARDAKR